MSTHPQQRKPWLHAPSGFWCAQVAGKRHYLDRDPTVAQRKLNRLLQEQQHGAPGRQWLATPFADLADEFLDDVQARRKPATYRGYRDMLELAQQHLGTALRVGEVRKFHLAKLEQALRDYSSTTVFKVLHAVQRVFSWAVEVDLLDASPLAGYKKPRPRQRSRVISAEEFQKMLAGSGQAFRRFLTALRYTGCRPGEVRNLTWDMVDPDGGLWIIPEHKTLTRQKHPRPRIIALPSEVQGLMQELTAERREGEAHVFLNADGRPWTRTALHSQMRRLRKRAGLGPKAGENVVLYTNRHTFGTEAVGKVSDIELAEAMGHTNTETTRRYVHLGAQRLRQIQQRIHG